MSCQLSEINWVSVFLLLFLLSSCEKENTDDLTPDPEMDIYRIPVVVHLIHYGEPLGEGYNLTEARIQDQIRLLNEDYRRKEGSRGFNNHPDGADAKIEFVLARTTPDGKPTSGIVRINATVVDNPIPANNRFDHYAYYSYWNHEHYLNIWVEPLPASTIDIVLGEATGPTTDLPGHALFLRGEPFHAEGVLINSFHFGESALASDHNLGRTLTHEVGHYLGLLHPWGNGDCETNDFCEDTPPVSQHHAGCPASPPLACNGDPAMIENYMDYTADHCMNMFTQDQVARMHYVLKNSPARKTLFTSPGLEE